MWTTINESIMTNTITKSKYKIVYGFDLDWTLIKPESNNKFWSIKDKTVFWHHQVQAKLNELHQQNIGIVLFTNQLGITTKKGKRLEIFTKKVKWFLDQFDFPIKVYAGIAEDPFRKPSKVMWNYFVKNDNSGIKLDKSKCMYIGDAAGRKHDFSCSDRKFAINIGIKFQTPEEFFLGNDPQPFELIGFNPREYKVPEVVTVTPSKTQELIIMVGSPASGKTTYVSTHFPQYERINQDTLKTYAKCIKACEIALALNKSVIIDNTNPTHVIREEYRAIAKRHNVPTRCIYLERSRELSNHLNILRNHVGIRKKIPTIAMNIYHSKFEEPTENVIKIPFIPVFENRFIEKMYMQIY